METPEPQEVEFTGEIKELPASGLIGNWVIGNYTVQVTAETEVRGRPEVGRRAEVKGWLLGDSLVQARRIKVKGR
jgi:hypothetical protein